MCGVAAALAFLAEYLFEANAPSVFIALGFSALFIATGFLTLLAIMAFGHGDHDNPIAIVLGGVFLLGILFAVWAAYQV